MTNSITLTALLVALSGVKSKYQLFIRKNIATVCFIDWRSVSEIMTFELDTEYPDCAFNIGGVPKFKKKDKVISLTAGEYTSSLLIDRGSSIQRADTTCDLCLDVSVRDLGKIEHQQTITAIHLTNGLNAVIDCVSSDTSNQILTMINLDSNGTFAATDGHVLSTFGDTFSLTRKSLNFKPAVLTLIQGLSNQAIVIEADGRLCNITSGAIRAQIPVVGGYPDYALVLAQQRISNVVRVNAKKLHTALTPHANAKQKFVISVVNGCFVLNAGDRSILSSCPIIEQSNNKSKLAYCFYPPALTRVLKNMEGDIELCLPTEATGVFIIRSIDNKITKIAMPVLLHIS